MTSTFVRVPAVVDCQPTNPCENITKSGVVNAACHLTLDRLLSRKTPANCYSRWYSLLQSTQLDQEPQMIRDQKAAIAAPRTRPGAMSRWKTPVPIKDLMSDLETFGVVNLRTRTTFTIW